MHWPEPTLGQPMAESLASDRGPVLITVEYRIEPARAPQFLAVLRRFSHERLRDGAYQWGVYEDMARASRYVEHFLVPSWLEHQRQHQRVSRADAELQQRVREFHLGDEGPLVQHFLAPQTQLDPPTEDPR